VWPLAARPAEGNSYSPQITIPLTGFNHKSRPNPDAHFNYTTEYGIKSFDYDDQGKGGGYVRGSSCGWKGGSGVYTGVTIIGKTGGRDLLR